MGLLTEKIISVLRKGDTHAARNSKVITVNEERIRLLFEQDEYLKTLAGKEEAGLKKIAEELAKKKQAEAEAAAAAEAAREKLLAEEREARRKEAFKRAAAAKKKREETIKEANKLAEQRKAGEAFKP